MRRILLTLTLSAIPFLSADHFASHSLRGAQFLPEIATEASSCQSNLCHICTPTKDSSGRPIAGPGNCCINPDGNAEICQWDRVFKEFICLPDYPWICSPDSAPGIEEDLMKS
ncbi:hypothetical protein TrCOL_g1003 [Triparma columacea]|uniref:Uncharacterized protein n=1 Tax=Triparma columacea TaxID=722753 RepID=A0A9W7L1Q6_9STRA|nr:hypothetical protein TrCOL_g1003 [Triparma columacea]